MVLLTVLVIKYEQQSRLLYSKEVIIVHFIKLEVLLLPSCYCKKTNKHDNEAKCIIIVHLKDFKCFQEI